MSGIVLLQRSGTSPFEVRTVRCSGCEVQKRDTNHWYVLTVIDKTFISEPYDDKVWGLHEGEYPVCGASCAQKKYEQYLQTGKL